MKVDGINHPKTMRLALLLGIPKFTAVGILECLFAFSAQYADDGRVGKYTPEELAAYIDWRDDPFILIDALVSAGWLEGTGTQIRIHDWADHCADYITKRMRRRLDKETAANGGQRIPTAANGSLPSHSNSNLSTPSNEKIEEVFLLFRNLEGFTKPNKSDNRLRQVGDLILIHGMEKLRTVARCFPLTYEFSNMDWKPNMDWLVKPGTVDKLTEGVYGAPRLTDREKLLKRVVTQGIYKLGETSDPQERETISKTIADAEAELDGNCEGVA